MDVDIKSMKGKNMKIGAIRKGINIMGITGILIASAGAGTKRLPPELRNEFKTPVTVVTKKIIKTLNGKTELLTLSNNTRVARTPNKLTIYYLNGSNKTMIKNESGDILSIARNESGKPTAFELNTQRTMTKDDVTLGLNQEFNPIEMEQSIPVPNDSNLFKLGNQQVIMETNNKGTSFYLLDGQNNVTKSTTISNTGESYTTNTNFDNITFVTDPNGNLIRVSGKSTKATGSTAGVSKDFSFLNLNPVDTTVQKYSSILPSLSSK